MTDIRFIPHDMTSAADTDDEAADRIKRAGSSTHLTTAGSALTGGNCLPHLTRTGDVWEEDVATIATSARRLATGIRSVSQDGQQADHRSATDLGRLANRLGA